MLTSSFKLCMCSSLRSVLFLFFLFSASSLCSQEDASARAESFYYNLPSILVDAPALQYIDSISRSNSNLAHALYTAESQNDMLHRDNLSMQKIMQRTWYVIVFFAVFFLIAAFAVCRVYYHRHKTHESELVEQIKLLQSRLSVLGPLSQTELKDVDVSVELPDGDVVSDKEMSFLQRVDALISSDPSKASNVEQLASALGYTSQTFRRRLYAATGQLPKAYISKIQMQKACQMLSESPDVVVSDVASQCGFAEASSFTRAFRQTFGMTPSQYRDANSKKRSQ